MKVHDLQQFIKALTQPLTAAGGKKAADDLQRAADGLNQFQDMTIVDFCSFLDRANHLVTTGELPKSSRRPAAPKTVVSAEQIQQKTQRLAELYERALDPDFSYDAVKQEVRGLANLKVDELKQIARDLNITRAFRKKDDILDALERRITERRATQERTQFRPPEETARPSSTAPEL
jgi:hypothetical protein